MSTVTTVPIQPVKRGYLVWLALGLALAVLCAAALAWAGDTGIRSTPSGLRYQVMKEGSGPHPSDQDLALVSYVGRLSDGTVFDRSQQPVPMPVAGVVPGFSEALKLMSKGARYRIWIPPQLGYGSAANGPIPANSTLQFDVELQEFLPEAMVRQLQMQQQMMQGGGAPATPAPPR